ncbi:universal stress protein [Mycobacteroides chelonae]|jgi:nucleotide-binding universal stress UspA family protein|uniref:Universal stress protein n=1 Tax=Mycobacteroides chelonae TaxID=1774 RepID=A0A1S1M433_MYCCH|nr:universal stress protein [Mycobacteroides chelonae]OHU76655.1 universal stress protein [Mycobacteroides chelonae]QQG88025.1 universal stress protein [Mycobacteroides chelonae]QQG92842.1 universal stress protein [Mycobacteroides chelonae]
MNTTTPRPYILVGIDGSASALHALTWAGAEAERRNLPLRLVHVVDYASFGYGFNLGAAASFYDHLDSDGAAFLSQAKDHAYALYPKLEVSTSQVTARPVPTLIDLSEEALLTVVGSSGLGRFTGMLAGSVSVSLTAKAHSPVVVVRESGIQAAGPIVVGVSESASSEDAIAWAFEEASMRGAELTAVHVWNEVPPGYVYAYTAWSKMDWIAIEQEQELILAERLAGWQEKFPDVTVHRVHSKGNPADVLLRWAQHAQLIVVGSRGRGDVGGFFLGSTSHALIHQSVCPVLIARAHASEDK